MRCSIRSLLLFAVMFIALDAQAQSDLKQSTETAGSISGRVTLGGKPATGVKVIAVKDERQLQGKPVATDKTDRDGNFQLTGLPSNHYRIVPLAPAYVALEQAEPGQPGKAVSLAEGEKIEGLEFALIRGGVITGRITDEDGQPVTGQRLTLVRLDPKGQKRTIYPALLEQYDFSTDDQGTYRIFGLAPGRYLVRAGQEIGQGEDKVQGLRYYPLTFYPDVTDESKAGVVELTSGSEATGIDITFGHSFKSHSVSGRIIDANTGKPVPNVQLGYGMTSEHGSSFSSGFMVDARGNFRLDGLLPGTFYLIVTTEKGSDFYSDKVPFQIKDQDITGLEIKARRGSSISGVLAVEGVNDPEVTARLSRLWITALVSSPDVTRDGFPQSRYSAVSPDGTFRIEGLQPGKCSFRIGGGPESKGFFISRVERGGIEYADGIEVGPGEHVTDARVIVGYASGRIRGQVKLEGGKLPPNAEMYISAGRVDDSSTKTYFRIPVDPNGRFVVEDLTTGEYQITVRVFTASPPGGSPRPLAREVNKRVSVTNGAESEVVIVVELIAKDKDQ